MHGRWADGFRAQSGLRFGRIWLVGEAEEGDGVWGWVGRRMVGSVCCCCLGVAVEFSLNYH
jgi:hypothetical protein